VALTFMPLPNQVVTVAYIQDGSTSSLFTDAFTIGPTIPSGPTDGQGDARAYKNTTTGNFEIYQLMNALGTTVLVINGETMALGFEYDISSSNRLRIILAKGVEIFPTDKIIMIYTPRTGVVGALENNKPTIAWYIERRPLVGFGGEFILQAAASTDPHFNTIVATTVVPHVVDRSSYTGELDLSFASVGDEFYYRVLNIKTYKTIKGLIIRSEALSDTIGVVRVEHMTGEVY